MNTIRHILVVDDDTRIRDLLSQYLKDNGYYVTAAKDAKEARQKLESFIFDLLIVDVMMPGESGTSLTKSLRKTLKTPILMLTAMGETEDRIKGLESGADDYLGKPFDPRELLLRIERILQRSKSAATKTKTTFGEFTFDSSKETLKNNEDNIQITTNEIKLLKQLCGNIGELVSRDDLAKLLGGINTRSVDVQITRLRNKIEKDPKKPQLLKTVRGKGYILHDS